MTNPIPQPASGAAPAQSANPLIIPTGFRLVPGIAATQAAHHLGYLRQERIVILAFHPEAGDIIWKDRLDSGFGTGGWQYYLYALLPALGRLGADLSDLARVGGDVLVADRQSNRIYIAPRPSADEFLAVSAGVELPKRRCICARPFAGPGNCATCPAH